MYSKAVPNEVVTCIPTLYFYPFYSVRTSAGYLLLTHIALHQVLHCHLGSHKSAVMSETNVFIDIYTYCYLKHSYKNTHLTPCPPRHLHTAGKGKTPLKTLFESPPFSQLSEWRCWLLGGTPQVQGCIK